MKTILVLIGLALLIVGFLIDAIPSPSAMIPGDQPIYALPLTFAGPNQYVSYGGLALMGLGAGLVAFGLLK